MCVSYISLAYEGASCTTVPAWHDEFWSAALGGRRSRDIAFETEIFFLYCLRDDTREASAATETSEEDRKEQTGTGKQWPQN